MYAEDDLLPVSALQHLLFCPRQCALIHVERLWAENSLTLEGRHLHQKADHGRGESRKGRGGQATAGRRGDADGTDGTGRPTRAGGGGRGGAVRIARGLMLRSLRLGLYGKADVVEFRAADEPADGRGRAARDALGRTNPSADDAGVAEPSAEAAVSAGAAAADPSFAVSPPDGTNPSIPCATAGVGEAVDVGLSAAGDGRPGGTNPSPPVPFPVEYKRGKPKTNRCDEVQLCAQALCLEEMLGTPVPAGAIFYGVTRRRVDVPFDAGLRAMTLRLIGELRSMVEENRTPAAAWEKKCQRCSLIKLCLPEARPGTDAAGRYLKRAVGQSLAAAEGPAGE